VLPQPISEALQRWPVEQPYKEWNMQKESAQASSGKETGSMRVYTVLRNEILTMKLAPGTPLDEHSVAERFDVSRSPVREALVRLSAEGLVTIMPNRSNVVATMEFARMPEFLDALDLLQRVTTRLAALNRTEADLVNIRESAKSYEKALSLSMKTGDTLPLIEKNYEFHMAVAKAGRNAYFEDLYRRLLEEGRRMLHLHFMFETLDARASRRKMVADHTEMVSAIEKQDVVRAEESAHQHAMQFKGRFMQFLDRNLTAQMSLNYQERQTLQADDAIRPTTKASRNPRKQQVENGA
jgi:DNA-binding GntR family transcriptional regulator